MKVLLNENLYQNKSVKCSQTFGMALHMNEDKMHKTLGLLDMYPSPVCMSEQARKARLELETLAGDCEIYISAKKKLSNLMDDAFYNIEIYKTSESPIKRFINRIFDKPLKTTLKRHSTSSYDKSGQMYKRLIKTVRELKKALL